jgi:hypothetical protein
MIRPRPHHDIRQYPNQTRPPDQRSSVSSRGVYAGHDALRGPTEQPELFTWQRVDYQRANMSDVGWQFLEDSYATAASFRKDGTWSVQTEPDTEPFQVEPVPTLHIQLERPSTYSAVNTAR